MSLFKDVSIEWCGKSKVIPARKILELIAEIEDHVTYFEVATKTPKFAAIAKGYSAALTRAGFTECSPEQVYSAMFNGEADCVSAVTKLLEIMLPPIKGTQENLGKSSTESRSESS